MNFRIFCFVLSTCTLGAWAQSLPAPKALPANAVQSQVSPSPAPKASALDAVMFYQLLLGELNALNGESNKGFSLILDAARKSKEPELFQRAIDLALQSRSGEAALQAARTWKQVLPASSEANRYILQILLALNKVEEAGVALKSTLSSLPVDELPAAIASVPRIFGRVNDKLLAANTVEAALSQALTQPGSQASAWTTIGRMRRDAGQARAAAQAAQKAYAADNKAQGPVMLALSLLEQEPDMVRPLILSYMAGPANPELRLGYARTLISQQQSSAALDQLLKLNQDNPEFVPGWLFSGLLLTDLDQPLVAEKALLRFVSMAATSQDTELQSGLSDAYFSLSQIAQKQGRITQAEDYLSKIPAESEPVKVGLRRANLLAEQGKLPQARQLLENIQTSNPEQTRQKTLALSMFLREHKEYQAAFDLLNQALKAGPDYELQSELAMAAERLGKFDVMELLLREMIAAKPKDAHAYNALGFSFADRNIRLSEAQQLIEQAVALAPNDPFIRDSLAWVAFRQGDTVLALQLLESAYKAKADVEIAAHLGEVLWVTGKTSEASTIWREGLLLKSDNETLLETLKRFNFKP
jgi:tetratricopeptide (TPR) repeat protein